MNINFLGIKYVLYYSIFYGLGWFTHWTQNWWKQWWPKLKSVITFCSIDVILAIIYNYDLYHCPDDLKSVALRCIAAFTGNLILLILCDRYKDMLEKSKLGWIGRYTLEIYATHMYVNGLMAEGNGSGFFTIPGFANFFISLVLTTLFTAIIIAVFKSNPVTDFVFYGKKKKYFDQADDFEISIYAL